MSIFRQILILIILDCCILLFVSYKNEVLFRQQLEAVQLNQMLYNLTPLYEAFSKGDIIKVKEALSQQGYKIKLGANIPLGANILYEKHGIFEHIIIWSRDTENGIFFMYLDDILLASKIYTSESERYTLNILNLVEIMLMIVIYLFVHWMLKPIKLLTASLERFKRGDYQTRVEIKQKNELGMLAQSFNDMASQISHLLTTKELLLRNAGHELRTPITKGKIALELMQDNEQKPFLKECFNRLDSITNSLLTLEYLHSTPSLTTSQFFAQTLLLQALSQSLADEDNVSIQLREDFQISGDLAWLATALKNLIDNALKYNESEKPIEIEVTNFTIYVKNYGAPLQRDFSLYLNAFVRGEEQQHSTQGYGLGLSIVKTIINLHHLNLTYEYTHGTHIISIIFPNS